MCKALALRKSAVVAEQLVVDSIVIYSTIVIEHRHAEMVEGEIKFGVGFNTLTDCPRSLELCAVKYIQSTRVVIISVDIRFAIRN